MATITIEIPAEKEALLRRFLALTEELDQLADSAPDASVVDLCEQTVVTRGQEVQRAVLQEAVQRRIDSAEKKGPRSDSVSVAKRKKTGDRKRGR